MKSYFILISLSLFFLACGSNTHTNKQQKNNDTIEYININDKCSYKQIKINNLGYLKNICKIKYDNKSDKCVNYMTEKYNFKDLPLINQSYVKLWQKNFSTLLQGTSLGFYSGDNLLWQNINNILVSFSDIKYELKAQPFIYEADKAYANFANRIWGGGVLRGANVQEEIKMRQSNALPWIAQKTNDRSDHVSWCPEIDINKLDDSPVVMSIALFLNFDNQKGYGRKIFALPKKEQLALLSPMKNSLQIYSIAMAAPYLDKNSFYSEEIIKNMMLTAVKAFYYTMLAMNHDNKNIEINTGNWGAGAFNHSVKMSWAVQLFSVLVANNLFKEKTHSKKETNYVYNSFGQNEAKLIAKAFSEIEPILKTNPNLDQVIKYLVDLSNQNKSWQVGASSVGED
jgi:hypothetical protein